MMKNPMTLEVLAELIVLTSKIAITYMIIAAIVEISEIQDRQGLAIRNLERKIKSLEIQKNPVQEQE
jgi:hypothetical protein